MAPEQVLGTEVDARTDLFSAAAILYEAVAGRPAFLGTTVVESSPPPSTSSARLSGDTAVVAFDRALRRAFAKRPADPAGLGRGDWPASSTGVAVGGGQGAPAVARPLTRLVVLPFRFLRPDPEIEFLSFALADAVSASLAGPSVVIRSSAAAARFATDSPDLKAWPRRPTWTAS